MIRIEPRKPPPPINLKEWDGFIRICFMRKNKTLGAIFKQNSALRLLAQNKAASKVQALLLSVSSRRSHVVASSFLTVRSFNCQKEKHVDQRSEGILRSQLTASYPPG